MTRFEVPLCCHFHDQLLLVRIYPHRLTLLPGSSGRSLPRLIYTIRCFHPEQRNALRNTGDKNNLKYFCGQSFWIAIIIPRLHKLGPTYLVYELNNTQHVPSKSIPGMRTGGSRNV